MRRYCVPIESVFRLREELGKSYNLLWINALKAQGVDSEYLPIRFKDCAQCVMLSQLRLWDGKRLTHKMGQLPDDQFEAVKQALRRLLK